MKCLCLIPALLWVTFLSYRAGAQNKRLLDNDSLLKVYLQQQPGGADTGAEAITLFEKGSARLKMRYESYYDLTLKTERYLKINKQQALDLANVSIPYANGLDVDDIDFQSINLVNGEVIREKLRKKDILKERLAGDVKLYKFNFRNIKPGSIIYYAYTYDIRLNYYMGNNLPASWSFQGQYPALESWFELVIPDHVSYRWVAKNVAFARTTPETFNQRDSARLESYNEKRKENTCIWRRHSVPAIKQEDYIRNPDLLTERINLSISVRSPFYNVESRTIPESWAKANELFLYRHPFLGYWAFHLQDTLSTVLDKLNKGWSDNMVMARDIYTFVRDSIGERDKNTNPVSTYWDISPEAVLKNKKGSAMQKNILLTALLRKAGFKSNPILLSTTNGEKIEERYFEMEAINYLISSVKINDKDYLLDASSKYLPFGILKPSCYNGFAWMIDKEGKPLQLDPDSLEERKTTVATITPSPKEGDYHLTIEEKLGNVSAPQMRAALKEDSVAVRKELEEEMSKLSCKSRLKSYKIMNRDLPDTSLRILYDLDMTLDTSGNIIYINPFFKPLFHTNPFSADQRRYPVEFGYAFTYQFILRFRIPDGYEPEDYNNPVQLSLNDYMFYKSLMRYDPADRVLSLSYSLSSKTATVDAASYANLRTFYDRIINEQHKKIALRKTN
ncbi:DUF3857 domain-containing protein [Taibaiella koreensis]|uniref:DUF3857 domain-containing protein n=1 Tax=Taibaiella koreensis TaxID=1268548 RepID=UPI0013C363D1|nr:DUF3857 domain-containing protein [Taibaiella koreensis]